LNPDNVLIQRSGIDFVAYDRDGGILLLAEAKSRRGTSQDWACSRRASSFVQVFPDQLPNDGLRYVVARMESHWFQCNQGVRKE
jgi:hypothetical protein